MTPQELKASILQLAIQGKLVEQRAEEGTVDTLLEVCKKNKLESIRDGKYKKEDFTGKIADESIAPFVIPESWAWVHISDMALFQEGPGILAVDFRSSGVPLIRIAGMQTDVVSLDGCNYLDPDMVNDKWAHFRLDEGDIVISTSASMDKIAVVDKSTIGAIPYTGLIRFKMYGGISKDYFRWFIQSPCYTEQVNEQKAGGTIKHYGPSHLKKMVIPIPPLAEQKRIVAKIEELLPYIDRYEQAWSRLEDFNRRFPVDMQKSILQMAIQGKLVEQRPEEGTGEELYQQIQQEKQRLIKAGTIKKEKPLPEITENEIPFDIPDGWKWVRFSELMISMSTGPFGSMLHKSDYVAKGIPLVNPANIVRGTIVPSDKMMISTETAKRLESYTLRAGMIVMGRRGEMGRCAVVTDIEDGWLCGTGSFFIQPSSELYVQYISTFFTTPYAKAYLGGESVGTTMSNLNHKILSSMPVPLPPLAEQKRIVAKLEELLPLCERLK
ncbi:MAG: restriction endonuclease subunit S [bacterium]|nr:restriction endonuclease subunit S [bacterium]